MRTAEDEKGGFTFNNLPTPESESSLWDSDLENTARRKYDPMID